MKIKQSMKKRLLGKARTAILAAAALVMGQQAALAQQIDCNAGRAYILGTYAEGQSRQYLYSAYLNEDGDVTNPTVVKDFGTGAAKLNGLGSYNGYLYAINDQGGIIRLDAVGNITNITVDDPNTLLSGEYTSGDVSSTGLYYIYDPTTGNLVSIDLTQNPAVVSLVTNLTGSMTAGSTLDDIAVHPNGNIYGVNSARQLIEITPAGVVNVKGNVTGALLANGVKSTLFFDPQNNMYIGMANGTIYKGNDPAAGNTWTASLFANPLTYLPNGNISIVDGARCVYGVGPVARNDEATIEEFNPMNLNVISNTGPTLPSVQTDRPGSTPIDPTSVTFYPDQIGGTGSTGPQTVPGTTAGQGTFTVDPVTGIVTFTPAKGFNGTAVIWYTIKGTDGVESNRASITITSSGALPVEFDAVSATLQNGQLIVSWNTLSEKGNSYFEIEASKDGKNFTKIGTVNTKADDGTSGTTIGYDFSVDLQNGNTLLGIALFSIAFIALMFNRKNKWLYTIILVGGLSIFGASSCSKNDAGGVDASGKVYVRIKQVNKDGGASYSKVVEVVKK